MSPVPIRSMVYILVGTQIADGAVSTGIGEVYTHRIDANQAAQRQRRPGVIMTVVERELHGPVPVE